MVVPFEIIREPADMRRCSENLRRDGKVIAIVPTMGYLHAGHLSLITAARARADVVILTLFVNPTQFGPEEDLERYPRDEAGDVKKARDAGADLVFSPTADAMYRPGHQTVIEVRELQQPLCGARRPGHFAGVATVVCKLFNLVQPQLGFFGEKDFQQLAIIRQMVRDLDLGVEICSVPILREPDGVAMSSRNVYLSPEERLQARSLNAALGAAQARFAEGERNSAAIVDAALAVLHAQPLARIDYAELRDARSLAAIATVDRPAVLALAVFFGKTRLIDNRVLLPARYTVSILT
jgi:pantoate--beta-alanine ligase